LPNSTSTTSSTITQCQTDPKPIVATPYQPQPE